MRLLIQPDNTIEMESEVGIMGPKCRHYSQVQNSYMADPYFSELFSAYLTGWGSSDHYFRHPLPELASLALLTAGGPAALFFFFTYLPGPPSELILSEYFTCPYQRRGAGAVLCGVLRLVVRLEGLGLRGVRVSIGVRG